MADADLDFLARQIDRTITEVGGLRDDNRVLTAMVKVSGPKEQVSRPPHSAGS